MARKARLCVADDNEQAAGSLARQLRLHAYDTVEAYSGQDALSACRTGGIDLILLDINMPDINGFEVCEQLKAAPDTDNIPVVFVTARGELAAIERGIGLGASDYITKPYNFPMVLLRVESVLSGNSTRAPMYLDHVSVLDSVYTDQMTGLRNRRYFMERLQEEADKADRYDFPLSVAIFAIRDFESLDESQHHLPTEDLLTEVAMGLRSHSRAYDVIARYDEAVFSVVLPHLPFSEAICYCEKILDEFDHTTLSEPKRPTRATLTAAAVTCQRSAVRTADDIFGEAMKMLLRAQSAADKRFMGRELPRV